MAMVSSEIDRKGPESRFCSPEMVELAASSTDRGLPPKKTLKSLCYRRIRTMDVLGRKVIKEIPAK
jgi:hypothetical protein